ncbi:MAG: AgmX/PglI C-terminal domain-containing protein [Myxococcota bacterium]
MKNLMFAGLGAGAAVGLALGYLFATKRVVLIVAPKSSEITVNEGADTPKPSRVAPVPVTVPAAVVAAPPPAAKAQVAAVSAVPKPATVEVPEPVPVETSELEDPSLSDDPLVRAIAERDAVEQERYALAQKAETDGATEEDVEDENEKKEADEPEKKKKERPMVVYDGIGRLGHVALTNVAKVKTKRGKSEKENPDTYYPHGRAEFDEPAFARVIKDTDSEVLRCYREARRYNPKLRGVVMAEMTVTPDGTIATAEVTDSSLEDRGVENCVKRLVRDLTFPRGVTSRPARVTYSWQLRPDAG